jgi:hypothetical protein
MNVTCPKFIIKNYSGKLYLYSIRYEVKCRTSGNVIMECLVQLKDAIHRTAQSTCSHVALNFCFVSGSGDRFECVIILSGNMNILKDLIFCRYAWCDPKVSEILILSTNVYEHIEISLYVSSHTLLESVWQAASS